jgi:hypothetical protein
MEELRNAAVHGLGQYNDHFLWLYKVYWWGMRRSPTHGLA